MKKITLIVLMILSAILIFALFGCSSNANPNEDAEKSDETAETVPPEQEETADLKELFEDKLSYLRTSLCRDLSRSGLPFKSIQTFWYYGIKFLLCYEKPISIETVGDPLDYGFKEIKTFTFDDLNKAAKYLFGMEIDFDVFRGKELLRYEVDFEERCVRSRFANKYSQYYFVPYGKNEITNVSENEDGTYTVDFSMSVLDLNDMNLEYYIGTVQYSALFSGKEDGYSILRVDIADDFAYSDFKPLAEDWIEANKGNKWFSKHLKDTVKRGRFVTEDRVMIEVHPVEDGVKYLEIRPKLAELLEKLGYSRYEFVETQYLSFHILVKPDQIKEVAECDFVRYIEFYNPVPDLSILKSYNKTAENK